MGRIKETEYQNLAEKNFTEKFKLLRKFYGLTVRDLATLLNYKNSASITNFERTPMLKKPSFQTIIKMQQLYGIFVDWLFGLSGTPYTEESVKQAEIEQQNRFSLDYDDIAKNPQTPEATISFLKVNLFPNYLIWQRLHLNDRFVLLAILYYIESQKYIDSKMNYRSIDLVIMNARPTTSISKSEEKHATYIKLLNTINKALTSSSNYKLSTNEKGKVSVLSERWNFLRYIQLQNSSNSDC